MSGSSTDESGQEPEPYDYEEAFRDHLWLGKVKDYLEANPTRKGTAPVRELTERLALQILRDTEEDWNVLLPAQGITSDGVPFACSLNRAFARRTVQRILDTTGHPAAEFANAPVKQAAVQACAAPADETSADGQ